MSCELTFFIAKHNEELTEQIVPLLHISTTPTRQLDMEVPFNFDKATAITKSKIEDIIAYYAGQLAEVNDAICAQQKKQTTAQQGLFQATNIEMARYFQEQINDAEELQEEFEQDKQEIMQLHAAFEHIYEIATQMELQASHAAYKEEDYEYDLFYYMG